MVRAPEFPADAEWIGTAPLQLADLRGNVVLLDFWTSGCINCVHILPNLHRLHRAFPEELQIIGVHTPKFPAEKDPERLALAVGRLDIQHPVVSDPDFAIWQSFAVSAWPTLVFIDRRGRIAARHPGEFDYERVARFVEHLLGEPRAHGAHDAMEPHAAGTSGTLSFPGKLAIDPMQQRLLISDSGHHRLLIATFDGKIETVIGAGVPGAEDGGFQSATFTNPQGLAFTPDGRTALVADAGNHLLRLVDLTTARVNTVAGTGKRGLPARGGHGAEIAIASPWDVTWREGWFLIAMAGLHQIWAYDPQAGSLEIVAGTGVESIHDDLFRDATFAQPMGLTAHGRNVYVADAESSAVRALDFDTGRVRRLLGRGLFHFGDMDAIGDSARLQHPQSIVATEEAGRTVLYLADTFNNKIKRIDPARRESITIAGTGDQGTHDGEALEAEFREPSGLALHGKTLYIADTHNHAIRCFRLDTGLVTTL